MYHDSTGDPSPASSAAALGAAFLAIGLAMVVYTPCGRPRGYSVVAPVEVAASRMPRTVP
jgi:hypothetical protein